jgi:hypothetical protein
VFAQTEGRRQKRELAVCKAKNAKKTYRLSVLVAKKNEETPKTQKQKKLTALV